MVSRSTSDGSPPCPSIPAGLEGVTPEWLTAALRSTGAIGDTVVASVDATSLSEGRGFAGSLARLNVRYAAPEPGAPHSLIVKLPTENRVMRGVARANGLYEREVGFYERIAPRIELRTPRPYYSHFDAETGDFVLLLEDLAPARAGDQLAGCSADEAALAVREIARFHAGWWEDTGHAELDWMRDADSGSSGLQRLYQRSWARLTADTGDGLPGSLTEVGERLGRNVAAVRSLTAQPPQTLVHGDFRLDNMFFDLPDGTGFAAVDWQLFRKGCGVFDVAWFISGCLNTNKRRSWERNLLSLYVSTLAQNGVAGYDLDRCLEDYRLSLLSCLTLGVIAAAAAERDTERGLALFEALMTRMASAVDDHRAIELMPKG